MIPNVVRKTEYDKIKAQRDELLAALKESNKLIVRKSSIYKKEPIVDINRKLIAKCEAQS